MKQVNWFEREFNFQGEQNIFPSIVERLWGTPARLEEKLAPMNEQTLLKREATTWTIKEHVGHLSDLEPLWQGRLDDILMSRQELRATDLANTATSEADHNSRNIQELLVSFRTLRMATIKKISSLSIDEIYRTALHPRLKIPMRVMDHFLFVAEHDDHHLARITELAGRL